jgi:CBS domain-containing protein
MPVVNALVKDVMTTQAVTIESTAPLLEAAKRLINARVSALPVVDADGTLAGIVSEADLIEDAVENSRNEEIAFRTSRLSSPVSDVMTRQIVTAHEGDTLVHVGRTLVKHRLKRLPVVADGTNRLVGVIGRVDLLRYQLSHLLSDDLRSPPVAPQESQVRQDVMSAIQGLGSARPRRSDVVVRNGIAHLWGELERQEDQAVCCAAAASVAGVRDVRSHMHVLGPLAARPGAARR